MKVDQDVEQAARKLYAAAVAQNHDWFTDAMAAAGQRGEDFVAAVIRHGVLVDTAALHHLHRGKPSEAQISDLLTEFVNTYETWLQGTAAESARPFLTALADHKPVIDVVQRGDLPDVVFAVGAWLLAAFLPEGKDWTDFLDEILDALETAPTQGSPQ